MNREIHVQALYTFHTLVNTVHVHGLKVLDSKNKSIHRWHNLASIQAKVYSTAFHESQFHAMLQHSVCMTDAL